MTDQGTQTSDRQIRRAQPQDNRSGPALISMFLRYGVALLAFAIPLILAIILRHYLIRYDLGILTIAALIGVAWYCGMGPGLMVAGLFEVAAIGLSNQPQAPVGRLVFSELNRLAFL